MRRVVVLNVAGLTPAMLGPAMPRLATWASSGRVAPVRSVLPAVTCTAQATYLTGVAPDRHGVVGNGWYFRDEGEVKVWRQSDRLVQAPKLWDVAREQDDRFTCASLFWEFAMLAGTDLAVCPSAHVEGSVHTWPSPLRQTLQRTVGRFPTGALWGPNASIRSSRWIMEAAKQVERRFGPTLSLVYLPHLDYVLQKLGPQHPGVLPELGAIDAVVGELVDFYESRGVRVVVLSEYGVSEVTHAIPINQMLRVQGYLAVEDVGGRELLDTTRSRAFAVADHQVAHVYVNDLARLAAVRRLVEGMPGVERVLDESEKAAHGLGHGRSGELVAIARRDAWFSYYYWLDAQRAPDFARTVDHRHKPGCDPVELFMDPGVRFPRMRVGWTHLKQHLGFRSLLDVVPLDPALVRGSHGRLTEVDEEGPLLITQEEHLLPGTQLRAEDVFEVLLRHLDLARGRRAA